MNDIAFHKGGWYCRYPLTWNINNNFIYDKEETFVYAWTCAKNYETKYLQWILHCACLSWAKMFIHYNHLPIKALSFLKITSMYSCHGPKLPTWSEMESYAVIFDKNLRYKNVFCICQTFFPQNWYEILLKVFNFWGLVFCFYTNIFLKKYLDVIIFLSPMQVISPFQSLVMFLPG